MKKYFLFILMLMAYGMQAQTLERYVVAAGGVMTSSPLQVDYTIGEVAVQQINAGDVMLTQGFHQPNSGIIPASSVFPYIVIYPNPTLGDAQARFILGAPVKLTISIYNVAGQLVNAETIDYSSGEMQYIIKSSKLTSGTYIIQFKMNDLPGKISKQLVKLN